MASKWFEKLTPKMAWDQYVIDGSIELFISINRNDGITDITEMCKSYVDFMPRLFEPQLFTTDQLDHIAVLIEQYIRTSCTAAVFEN